MRWSSCVLVVIASVFCGAQAQPTTCLADEQCTAGYYCLATAHYCQECVSCEQAHREPPSRPITCIKSVLDCGPCIKGFEDKVDSGCSEPDSNDGSLPPYIWAVIIICLLIFLVVVGAMFFWILRHTDTFKVLASSSTSVQAPVVTNGIPPTAPAPPPYNFAADYAPLRPSSPPAAYEEDASEGLMKILKTERGSDARESAGSQAARPYNAPSSYVRNAQLPPSYDSAISDKSDDEEPFAAHDEDTMESVWRPEADDEGAAASSDAAAAAPSPAAAPAGATFSGALRRPSRADNMSPPPKILCTREDTNNNRSQPGGGEASPAPPAAPSFVINVNVNAVHQRNDVTL